MKKFRQFILLTFFVFFAVSITCGQSLVMTGNEVFEQESPKKDKQKIDKYKINVKPTKQGKPVIIPSLKIEREKDKKEKLSNEKNDKGQKFTSLANNPNAPLTPKADMDIKTRMLLITLGFVSFLKNLF